MPITSCAPRLAEMKASPAIQAGIERPDRKKSVLVCALPLEREPDAQHEREVDDQDDVVDPLELHQALRRS